MSAVAYYAALAAVIQAALTVCVMFRALVIKDDHPVERIVSVIAIGVNTLIIVGLWGIVFT